MANWPSTLPPIRIPVSIQKQDGVLRTQMSAGPDKTRKQYTATPTYISFPLRMTGEQYETLMSFYEDNQAIAFDMDDPTSGISASMKFMAPPEASVITGASDPDKRIVDVNIKLEKLP